MFPFSQSVTPAVRSHLEAQMAFMNDMSKSMFHAFQQLCDLNIQLTQSMLEESTTACNSMLTADRQTGLFSAAASRAQPATDKLRAYQQHISRVAADTQVEIARVAEQHVQETTRTARALADEVARMATEEADRNVRAQQETMRKFSDPFQTGNGHMRGNGGAEIRTGAGMQSSGQGSHAGGSHADAQGNIPVQSGSQSGRSGGASSRKET
ncbi:MAG: phasin family protein [Telluria sp.]